MMKHLSFGGFLALFMVSCSHLPTVPTSTNQPVQEYSLDVKAQMLRASKPELDKPVTLCTELMCYVMTDDSMRRIKKYIVELEERSKSCK